MHTATVRRTRLSMQRLLAVGNDRVVAARMQRMTASDAAERLQETTNRPVHANALGGVGGAGGVEATSGAGAGQRVHDRRDDDPIDRQQAQKEPGQDRAKYRAHSFSISPPT